MYTYHIKEMMYVITCKKSLIKIGLYSLLFALALLITLLPQIILDKGQTMQVKRFPTDLKYVLFWYPSENKRKVLYDYNHTEFPTGQKAFIEQKCPHISCYIAYNKSYLDDDERNFDAVVFNAQDISKMSLHNISLERSPHQKYIFRSQEPAERHPICHRIFEDFFNLTWTYKLNSDIPQPFINVYDINNKLVGPSTQVDWIEKMNHTENFKSKIEGKEKAIAWIVTKCKAKNTYSDFIKGLRNELKGYNYTLDIYGPCGDIKCPKQSIYSCYKLVEKKYFFQLVLEDAMCEDYVTEKVVKSLMHFTIPVVFGSANYTRFLPPGSYINFQEFGLKKFGALIDYLMKTPQNYGFLFDWKNHYFYSIRPRSYICDLCTKLNENGNITPQRHFRRWWFSDYRDVCDRLKLVSLFSC
ncbi:alpha-(1,3)-fucosyltransferase C-like [Amyelois transitella]|uniref:alpha-(1,3)-fucosyltransferase C-like n=1 Tax=Amyelois transitella TaxID=680683 RepID=UPI00298FFCA2|nr:alpha-(1,3)-fucosyltransferase C-like [Amyelois transitella]